jgi:formylglycine-generating enzyme required for sulfatase activity
MASSNPASIAVAVGVSSAKLDSQLSPQQILDAFHGNIAPAKVPIRYKVGILLVAVLMIVLPLVYLAIIGLVGYAIYWHAIHDAGVLAIPGNGKVKLLAFTFYLAPFVGGGILILFMFKPLFSRVRRSDKRRSLDRNAEPLLFAFVDRICAAVGARPPKRIDIDCQVNASAGFRRGWLSFLGSDLVLTIGLPLVAGLSLRQFAGVLAHEFGHFSQGAGMRLTYIIRSINFWFTRVVYERDHWDQQLEAWARTLDLRIGWILYLAMLFVYLTRKLLWLLMMIGHVASGYMMRQMEFDADRYEAQLAGSKAVVPTFRQLAVLNVATQGAYSDLATFYRDGRLGDNLPELIIANIKQIPAEIFAKIDFQIETAETGLFDTHPADRDRIAQVRRENAPGIFGAECPAKAVFADFESLSKEVTWGIYQETFGNRVDRADLKPVHDLIGRQEKEQEAQNAVNRFFIEQFTTLRPLCLTDRSITAPADPRQVLAQLKAAREQMASTQAAYGESIRLYDSADTQWLEADRFAALWNAKLTPAANSRVSWPSHVEAMRTRSDARTRMDQIAPQLTTFEQAAASRLWSSLQLLYVPKLLEKLKRGEELRDKTLRIAHVLMAVNAEHDALFKLRNNYSALSILVANLQANQQHQPLISAIQTLMGTLHTQLTRLRTAFVRVPYPLDHAKGAMSVADFLLNEPPKHNDLGGICGASQSVIENLPVLQARLLGRLVILAERIESLAGLQPLSRPALTEERALPVAVQPTVVSRPKQRGYLAVKIAIAGSVLLMIGILLMKYGFHLSSSDQKEASVEARDIAIPRVENLSIEAASKGQPALPTTDLMVSTPSKQEIPAGSPPPAIAPFDAGQARVHQEAWAQHLRVPVEKTNVVGMEMMLIPPGEFMMGSTPEEIAIALKESHTRPDGADRTDDDRINSAAPRHPVRLTKPFRCASTETTLEQFRRFVDSTGYQTEIELNGGMRGEGGRLLRVRNASWKSPGDPVADRHPVTWTTWNDATEFCNWLSGQEGLTPYYRGKDLAISTNADATGYRLPTEAQWEYCCRAGSTTSFCNGNEAKDLSQVAWYSGNSGKRLQDVGTRAANSFGLHDMHGSVWEYCQDYYSPHSYQASPAVDPNEPSGRTGHALRGGAWYSFPFHCRSSFRHFTGRYTPRNYGFRVVLPIM